MSKSILVIDTPRCCYECNLYIEDPYRNWCAGTFHHPHDDQTIPNWCPLKELPKRMEGNDSVYYQWGDYEDGWNHCLDVIKGDV